jgi:hypothetical protein
MAPILTKTITARTITAAAMLACTLVVACAPGNATNPSPAANPPAAVNPAAPKPANASMKIVSPTQGAVVSSGSIKASVSYSGPTLVPGAEATKLDDYHLHYFLDEDAGAYLGGGRSIPAGNPHIVHSGAKEVTFDKLTPGPHTIAVVMSGNNHVAVTPSLTDSVTFTVQ